MSSVEFWLVLIVLGGFILSWWSLKSQRIFTARLLKENSELLQALQLNLSREQGELKSDLRDHMYKSFDHLKENVTKKLDDKAKEGQLTFQRVIERLARIDEAQKQMESFSKDVTSLQHILTDKKTRGILGEVQLAQVMYNCFGEDRRIYSLQQTLKNGTIVDCIVHLPPPMKSLCIDSKFPLENFKRLEDENLEKSQRDEADKLFKRDLKKHIDDIAGKYIITEETSDQAVMFVPAEAIFSTIHSKYFEIVDYANKRKVWIASPTTLLTVMSTVQMIFKNYERSKHSDLILGELVKLSKDFTLFENRWDKLVRSISSVQKSVEELDITREKITRHFRNIADVNVINDNRIGNNESGTHDSVL